MLRIIVFWCTDTLRTTAPCRKLPFSKIKWGRHFDITDLQWKKYNNIPFQCTKSSKLQWLQYRINQHILTTNKILHKIGLKDDNLCSFCNSSEETIIHILWKCAKVQELLDNISILCKRQNIEFPKESCTFILEKKFISQ